MWKTCLSIRALQRREEGSQGKIQQRSKAGVSCYLGLRGELRAPGGSSHSGTNHRKPHFSTSLNSEVRHICHHLPDFLCLSQSLTECLQLQIRKKLMWIYHIESFFSILLSQVVCLWRFSIYIDLGCAISSPKIKMKTKCKLELAQHDTKRDWVIQLYKTSSLLPSK